MKSNQPSHLIAAACLVAGLVCWLTSTFAGAPFDIGAPSMATQADPPGQSEEATTDEPADAADATATVAWQPAVDPKPLSTSARLGLAWLVEHQQEDGGWNAGEGASSGVGRGRGTGIRSSLPAEAETAIERVRPLPADAGQQAQPQADASPSNVADTAMAALALLRGTLEAGLQPQQPADADEGTTDADGIARLTDEDIESWHQSVRAAARFICTHIEQAEDDSLAITKLQGTRLQQKIGAYVDTFVAALFLTEYLQTMSEADEDYERFRGALDDVIARIQTHQKEDGSWTAGGWAGDLSLSVAGKAVNRAAQAGFDVSPQVLERVAASGNADFDRAAGGFDVARSAGIELYAASKSVAQLQDTANTFNTGRAQWAQRAESADTEEERQVARDRLAAIDENDANLEEARSEVVKRMRSDDRFVAGFGTNGGEEFLSYMNLGESLVIAGGDAWKEWDEMITARLTEAQNKDGSWSGHHCITGRTFCTSAALLVLMVDRAPVPKVAAAE